MHPGGPKGIEAELLKLGESPKSPPDLADFDPTFDQFWPNEPEWAGSREENGPNVPNGPERAKWSVFDNFWPNGPEWAGSREENGPNGPNRPERAKWSVLDQFWPNEPEWAGSI